MHPWPPRKDDEPLDWGDPPVEPPPPPSAGRSVRLGFSAVYDYLGTSLAVSLLTFVVVFFALSFLYVGLQRLPDPKLRAVGAMMTAVVLLAAPIVLGPFMAGLYTLARAMFQRDDPHIFDLFRGARKLARPAWALCYAETVITSVLVCDTLWLISRPSTAIKAAGVGAGYILLFWLMTAVYHWPLLVEQGKPLGTTLKRGVLLALANPFYSLAFALLTLVMTLGPALVFASFKNGPAILIPVSLLWGALLPALHTSAALEILRKYPDPNGSQDA
ncbi:MAG TPA: hypothetical protein VGM37_12180 [Armatimonadota bacterium]|jgi:hypothetical protein